MNTPAQIIAFAQPRVAALQAALTSIAGLATAAQDACLARCDLPSNQSERDKQIGSAMARDENNVQLATERHLLPLLAPLEVDLPKFAEAEYQSRLSAAEAAFSPFVTDSNARFECINRYSDYVNKPRQQLSIYQNGYQRLSDAGAASNAAVVILGYAIAAAEKAQQEAEA